MDARTPCTEPDWSLWRSFAAVVEHGSLSAAARQLGLSQPTLGRHVEALEQALGVSLFERTLQGLKPTDTALRLYEPVAGGAAGAGRGGDAWPRARPAALSGTRAHHLEHGDVPLRAAAAAARPAARPSRRIAIELVPSDSVENLLLREADIAVRMFRPTQLELITRKLGEIPIVACAHESYLQRRGAPETPDDLRRARPDRLRSLGPDRSARRAAWAIELKRSDFVVRTDSQTGDVGVDEGRARHRLCPARPGARHAGHARRCCRISPAAARGVADHPPGTVHQPAHSCHL